MSTEKLRGLIRDAILATAAEGRVVIGAHAASFALAGRDDVLRVLVTASTDVRGARIAAADGLDEKAAVRQLEESDKGRSAYLASFYGVSRELPTHYDLVVNTDRLAPDVRRGDDRPRGRRRWSTNSLEIGRKTS